MNVVQFLNTVPEALLEISRNREGYFVKVKHSDIKDGGMLKGYHGRGVTLVEALNDLSDEIRNRTLIFEYVLGDYSSEGRNRKEYEVPNLRRIAFLEDLVEDVIEDVNNIKLDNLNKVNLAKKLMR